MSAAVGCWNLRLMRQAAGLRTLPQRCTGCERASPVTFPQRRARSPANWPEWGSSAGQKVLMPRRSTVEYRLYSPNRSPRRRKPGTSFTASF